MFGFIIGIIGNLVASYAYDMLRTQERQSPPLVLIVQPETIPSKRKKNKGVKFDPRALRRERARRIIMLLFFFSTTLLFLKYAIYLPILLGHFGDMTLDLSHVKIISWFTDNSVEMSSINKFTTIVAVFLYFPILLAGDKLLVIVRSWYDIFWPVTFDAWIALRFGLFLFLSLLLSGIVTYLVTNLSILWAMAAPFIALLLAIAFAMNDNSDK